MKLKLDENIGERGREILAAAGHDVATVVMQGLKQAEDQPLIDACRRESRALVTLDLDFANTLLLPPRNYAGIAVLRLPRKPSRADLLRAMVTLTAGLRREKLEGELWIVEPGRIRVHQPAEDGEV